jgi:hypothetical protein
LETTPENDQPECNETSPHALLSTHVHTTSNLETISFTPPSINSIKTNDNETEVSSIHSSQGSTTDTTILDIPMELDEPVSYSTSNTDLIGNESSLVLFEAEVQNELAPNQPNAVPNISWAEESEHINQLNDLYN